MSKEETYRPLARGRRNLSRSSRLWLGKDHILSVSSVRGYETYRRYYLHEIQALIVRPTRTALVWSIILGLSSVALLVTAERYYSKFRYINEDLGAAFEAIEPFSNPLVLSFAIPGLILLVIFLWYVSGGLSCNFFVQTRPAVERLPMVHRRRRARKVLATLVPLIAAAQATVPSPAPIVETPVIENPSTAPENAA